jgi:hypothetical protein
LWKELSVVGFKYALARAENAVGVCGIDVMRLKDGNRSAVVLFGEDLDGSDDAVRRILLNG